MNHTVYDPACPGCQNASPRPVQSSLTEAYIEGWHAGVTAASNIFDRWYRENCITAGATNAIELAQRLFKEANMSPNSELSSERAAEPHQQTGADARRLLK